MTEGSVHQTIVLIRGAGEQASGIAHRLFRSGFQVCMLEETTPRAVRRMVSYCEAVYDGKKTVENVTAVRVDDPEKIGVVWASNKIPLLIDPANQTRFYIKPLIVVDAILAKKNLGTKMSDAACVIALGPGFYASRDAHVVIETNRGHNLGRLIYNGEAEPNTGKPGSIGGYDIERVLRAPRKGIIKCSRNIGDKVRDGETVAHVVNIPIKAAVSGIIRGMLRDGSPVIPGMKAGDIDPRGEKAYCSTISDKARTISGSVLEAILYFLARQ
jgi:xanthine dehydrogenase accessory factor